MDVRFSQNSAARTANVYRTAGRAHRALLDRMEKRAGTGGSRRQETAELKRDTVSLSAHGIAGWKAGLQDTVSAGPAGSWETAPQELIDKVHKLNIEVSCTMIGDLLTLNDGTTINKHEIPRLDVGSLPAVAAKNNVMDFGSGRYFKYTTSEGKEVALLSNPSGFVTRPISEDLDLTRFDLETERYADFWNHLAEGSTILSSPAVSKYYGYTFDQERAYLDEAGVKKGFFSVKAGSRNAELFYSSTKYLGPIHTKEEYDDDYRWMTSTDCPYNQSKFSSYEPGTEIMVGGEKYRLKEDLTLDLPYGIDIFDIQIKRPDTKTASAGVDIRI